MASTPPDLFSLDRRHTVTTTLERLQGILARDYKIDAAASTIDAPLDGLGIDSLGTVELLWTIEDQFGIKLPSEPGEIRTVGDVASLIDATAASQSASEITRGSDGVDGLATT